MKLRLSIVLVLLFGLLFTSRILAQDPPTIPAEAAADLRARLVEVQAREAERHTRLNQLDEALKPENIERSLAGIGSTRPEERSKFSGFKASSNWFNRVCRSAS